jgi:hypothetical protein
LAKNYCHFPGIGEEQRKNFAIARVAASGEDILKMLA